METGKAIYKLLKDSSAVGAICADRIYPELAQQDADAPFVVYTVVDTTPSDTKTSTSKVDTARVELYCVGDDYETVMDLGIAVRGALDRQSGTISGVQVQSISFDASDIQFDGDQRVYVLEQTYNTRVQRTGSATTLTTFPGNSWTIEEVDGAPTGAVNKVIVSNGSLTIDGNTATLDTGGSSSGVTSVNSLTGTVELYGTNLNVQSGVAQTIYGKFQSIDGDLTSILQILKGSAQNELGVFSDVSDNTKPSLKVTTTNAILRGGTATLIKAEQTSPGTLTFAVAAGASDTETTGMLVAGQANGNVVTTFPLEVRFTGSTSGIDYGDLDNTPTTITAGQASAITANTAKTGITSGQASAITANTAKTGITSEQADAITANTAKTGITSEQASAIAANTAKTGITSGQASAITANTAKTGITSGQASAITANTAKTTFPGFGTSAGTALEGDTPLLELGTTSSTALAGDTTTITSGQASAITANTAKTGITSGQASAITANTAKTGITSGQANAITANTAKVSADGSVTTHNDVSDAGSGAIITGDERTKLTGIEAGAEVNVNADWNATSGDAEILNKPTIPTVPVDDVTGGTGLTASPTTGNVVVNLDDTAVTAGSYTAADITVDAQGRITAAANGSGGGGGGVTSVTGTAPIASSGGTTPAISITAATTSAAGSLSAADKTKLDSVQTGAKAFPAEQAVWAGAYESNGRFTIPTSAGFLRWDTSVSSVSGTRSSGTGSLPSSPVYGDLWTVQLDQNSNCNSLGEYIVPVDGWYEFNIFVAVQNTSSSDANEVKMILAPGFKVGSSGAWSNKKLNMRTTKDLFGSQYDGTGGTCVFYAEAGEYIVPLFYYLRAGSGSSSVKQVLWHSYTHAAIRQIA